MISKLNFTQKSFKRRLKTLLTRYRNNNSQQTQPFFFVFRKKFFFTMICFRFFKETIREKLDKKKLLQNCFEVKSFYNDKKIMCNLLRQDAL